MLVHQPVDGGVGRHVADLARGLTERGHEVVLCGPAAPDALPALPDGASHVRMELDRAISPRADLAAVGSLAALVRRLAPAVVHAHSSKAGAVARLGHSLQPRVPVLYTPHGYAFAGFFSSAAQRRAYREIERLLAPLATRVVCVCAAEARLAATVGPRRRVRVVHNGVEPAGEGPIDPRMRALGERGPVVCALTQLRAGKGIETLIDATPALLARHPRAQVAIWGDGPELASLRARACTAGVAHAVHFPGSCEHPPAVLRGVEVFVHPSLAEAFPYVILEAMAASRAIAASDVGGIGEALGGGECGVLLPPGDARSLANAVNGLLEDPSRRAQLGAAAQRRIRQRFSRAAMLDRLMDVYSEVSD